MHENFWVDKSVFVTGGNGFIGSWLTERLVNAGAKLTLLIKKDDPVGVASISNIAKKVEIAYGDIRDAALMKTLAKEKEVVFHLAAITQVIYSIKHPVEAVEVDINGTLNILEAMREGNSDALLVFTSTDKVYGEPNYVPIDESHPLSAKSPYDASKLGADRLVHSYHMTYGLKSTISRCSNVIGGRDANVLRAIPSFVYFLLNKQQPVIRTNGKKIRDYLHVDDAVDALLTLAEKQKQSVGFAFNFGTGKPTTVLRLAEEVGKYFDQKLKPMVLNKETSGEIDKQYLSSKLVNEKLGWKPSISFEEGVKRAANWYKENPSWFEVIRKTSEYYNIDMKEMFG